tara:strand:- start:39 stop:470 length:432 start_codon:yes stop_codon:yes gene_type:complete
MANYCLVENGEVTVGPTGLPMNWRNISSLHLATVSELKERGWLPAVLVEPTFDATTHKRAARSVAIGTDDVTFTWATEVLSVSDKWENWKQTMTVSALDGDVLSRELEDHIESDHAGKAANAAQQAKYDEKKAKRALKPAKPE